MTEQRPESGLGYHLLLGFLLLMFLLGPLFQTKIGYLTFGEYLFDVIVIGSMIAVARARGPWIAAVALGLPALVLQNTTPDPWSAQRGWALGFTAAYLVLLTGALVLSVKSHRRVTSATVSGSLCVYLLMGLVWGFGYQLLNHFDPEAFRGLVPVDLADATSAKARESQLNYFSFVTLTTLGYGDVTPASAAARSLANTEAIVGQLFLVVAVARIVGLQVANDLMQKSEGTADG